MYDGGGAGDEELEGAVGVAFVAAELVELVVGEGVAEGVSPDFCSIDRVLGLLFVRYSEL